MVVWATGYSQTDPKEYATGTKNATQQLQDYPLPRFKPGHTMNRNFNWFDLAYFSGWQQPGVSNQQLIQNAKTSNVELHENWNYYFMTNANIGSYGQPQNYADTVNTLSGALTAVAKRNPHYKTSAICFWAQIGGNVTNSNLSAPHYLRNSSGQFLDANGNVSSSKFWSPIAPDASIISDGQRQKTFLQNLVNALGRPVDIINENGEVINLISRNGGALTNDPALLSDYLARGYPTNRTTEAINNYRGERFAAQHKLYRDQFMPASPGTKFTFYGLDGQRDYRPVWEKSKDLGSKINNRYYPTGDFYPRWPNNWRSWNGPWHGLGWFADCKYYEMQNGDSLMSPFVSAGWDNDETKNVRPALYLANLKILAAWGSEFFYSGYFSLAAPFPSSTGWAYQVVMPVYAQAVMSRAEEFMRNGELMNGDVPQGWLGNVTLSPTTPKYLFNTGSNNQLVAVRKMRGTNKYFITGAQMSSSNTIGSAPMSSLVKFKLGNDSLRIEIRRQGSVYVYDATNPNDKVFYQLDKWHQYEHPELWSKDFEIEAELMDNAASAAVIKTEVPAGTPPNDYSNFTSYISFNATTPPVLQYNFTPRNQSNYYVWLRVRSKNTTGGSVTVGLSGASSKTIGCITNTNWHWVSVDACSGQAIQFTALTNKAYILSLTASSNNIEIDRILLSTSPNTQLNPNQVACGTSTTTVNTSGPTSFCQGGNVTLTANGSGSYTWSSGQTTQSITVNQSGNYNVSVNSGSGCASVSNPINVTVLPRPIVNVSAGGATSICQGQSVSLTASGGNTYTWSNGASTATINASTAGSYSVIATGSNGCTSASQPVTVSVVQAPPTTVTSSGATTFCQGGTVTLSAPTGYTYAWSNGKITSQIVVNTSGTYSVTVSSGNNCSSTSQPVAVIVNALPAASVTASGPLSFCQGSGVTLNATGGTSYQWTNGQTGSSITVNNSGSFSARVTDVNGCSANSNIITVNANPAPTAGISVNGATTLNFGQTTTLVANGGTAYVWQPGGQTTSSITVSSAGNYTVTAFNANGCSATSQAVTINVGTTTPVEINGNATSDICQGQSVTLSTTGGSNLVWYPGGQTTSSITVDQAGTYRVHSRDNNGNILSSDSVYVNVKPKPLNPAISITYIPNTAFQLNAFEASAVKYSWNTGATTASINVNQPTTVGVIATNAFGCSSGITRLETGNVMAKSCSAADMLTAYSISDTTAVLGWNPAITGDQFIVRYWTRGNSNVFSQQVAGNLSTLRIRNLVPGAQYNWSIETVCQSGNSMSRTGNFSTLRTPLPCGSIPQHLRADNINERSVNLKWYVTTADTFTLKFREAGSSNFMFRNYSGPQALNGSLLNGLNPNTTYEWMVRSTCSGYTSPYSQPQYFKTIDTCGNMGQVNIDDLNTSSVTVRWTNSAPMDTVRLRLTHVNSGGFRNAYLTGNPLDMKHIFYGLRPNTTYQVEVRGKCGSTRGVWSTPIIFTTPGILNRVDDSNPLGLNAYPNPATETLFYTFSSNDEDNYVVKVCDMSGRELMQKASSSYNGANAAEIPVNQFAKGVYLLIVQKGTLRSQFRFSVQ